MLEGVKTPSYVVDKSRLRSNLELLADVRRRTGCHILLAQKCFSMYSLYPFIAEYIDGTTASGLFEARLGHEEMGRENHVFAPAFKDEDMDELVRICDHIVFNSFAQLKLHKAKCDGVSVGIRVNPQHSTQGDHAIYDPCSPGSRMGVVIDNFPSVDEFATMGIDGLHFHTLCEQNSDDLVSTFNAFEKDFAPYLRKVKWLNMGGGHHITRADYDVEALVGLINRIRRDYGVEVYLEPGEAVALNAGYMVTEVMDIVENGGIRIAIMDFSAACHCPDVIEAGIRLPLRDAGEPGEKPFTYRLSSNTCLAGDVTGDYSFDNELKVGDRLIFEDMAIYSMVKNNTFNGIPLPDICLLDEDGSVRVVRTFGYNDFKSRL